MEASRLHATARFHCRAVRAVRAVRRANGQQDYSWSLERSSASYSTVTLPPGQAAHFDLIYLPKAAGDSSDISAFKLVITPPTHPGTYITPVVSGS